MKTQVRVMNQMAPLGVYAVQLGDRLDRLISLINELHDAAGLDKATLDDCRTAVIELIDDHEAFRVAVDEILTKFNTLTDTIDGVLAKLDADAGVTDTNYAALWGTGGSETNATPADVSNQPPPVLSATDPPESSGALGTGKVEALT